MRKGGSRSTVDGRRAGVGGRLSATRPGAKDRFCCRLSTADCRLGIRLVILGVLAVQLSVAGAARAQAVYGTASLADPLPNLEGSARDLGMGSAFVGVADDGSALFFNSAGLSGLRNPEVALHHNSYLAGTFEETLTAGFPLGDGNGLAFALDYIGWGSLDLRDSSGEAQGTYNDSDVGFTAAWGREWFPGFSAGLALRGVQQKVVNDLYTSLAADLGLLWRPAPGLRLGAAALNLGTPVGGSSLERQWSGGGSYLFGLGGRNRLLAALSASFIPGGEDSLQAGLEGTLDGRWSLRAGYRTSFFDNQTGGLTGFTAGAGARLGSLALDYAYVPFGTLGTSHRVSLSYRFDLPKEVVRVQVPVTVLEPVPEAPNPKDVEVRFKISTDPLARGQELEKEGKKAEAAQVYVEALKADPRSVPLWSSLGRLYYEMGRKQYAVRCFDNVLKLKPGDRALKAWLEKYKARAGSR